MSFLNDAPDARSSTFLKELTNKDLTPRKTPPIQKTLIAPLVQDINPSHSKCLAAVNAYKMQMNFFKKKIKEGESEAQKCKGKYEKLAKQTKSAEPSGRHYREIFS
ncbi:uncharacterized protein LOC116417906 [Nasonia vitripennis]|uniref:Uncharacterized protein n=1 Tax=Nasonia vitripennis TaxID=7425 RepID=A0A7M7QKQ2_NASVI|nr:uncharacterized protein LOC116417906 [Nasonia vitripennis]